MNTEVTIVMQLELITCTKCTPHNGINMKTVNELKVDSI